MVFQRARSRSVVKSGFLGTLIILTTILGIVVIARADVRIDKPPVKRTPPNNRRTPTPKFVVNALELSVHQQVNQYRQSLDLPPLVFDPAISIQARIHSNDMAKTGKMNHDGFNDRANTIAQTINYRSVSENVATNMGYDRPDAIAVKGWLESPGHHRNIIGRYDLTGIGVSRDAKGEYFFTQIFVRKIKQ